MTYTLGTAAQATGVSKTSIHRAIRNGRISAVKGEAGDWRIEPAELHRVYPPVTVAEPVAPGKTEQSVTPGGTDSNALAAQLDGLKALLAEKDRRIGDLETDRDRWARQAERLALTHQPVVTPAPVTPPTVSPVPSLWSRILGHAVRNRPEAA
ncbi:helix-turn-helix domain-containing protein [Methylocella sp.]|uniref:helix-turn-helix domain-containing protein n=1 Tax=Methylocella sp. TaxID=1978226 RepID=UPI0035B1F317